MRPGSILHRCAAAVRRRPGRTALLALAVLLVAGNGVAFVQAWSMTHLVPGGSKTLSPEKLTSLGKLRVLLTGIRVPRPVDTTTPADLRVPFTTRHVASDGLDLEVWAVPSDAHRAMVLMYHGYGASKSSLVVPAVQFHNMGCEVELVDFRGSGGSGGNVTTVGYREADDVAATVADARSWRRPGEPVVLLGQSMGAAAILRAVGDLHVPADGLLLESPYDRLRSTAANRFSSMGLPPFPAADLLIFWGGVQQGYWAAGLNPADSARSVRCPAIVFQGGRDARVTTAQARSVFDGLGGPKQFELFDTSYHCGFREADPARWRRTVEAFLDTVAGAATPNPTGHDHP
jgi:alpha-beta hydrolase superfamily lysophospholipase